MAAKKIGNSIFRTEREAGVDSALGDWRNQTQGSGKSISVRYLSCEVMQTQMILKFEVTQLKPQEGLMTIYVTPANDDAKIIATDSRNLKYSRKTFVDVQFNQSSIYPSNSLSNVIQMKAHLNINSQIAKSRMFSVSCSNPSSLTTTDDEATCLGNGVFTEAKLTKVLSYLRKEEKTGVKVVLRDKSNTKNYKLGEPVLDKDGKKIRVERTMYDEYGLDVFSLKVNEKISPQEATIKQISEKLQKAFVKYDIINCRRKIHFLAQAYHETQRFLKTYEGNPSSTVVGGKAFRGRGFLQLTHDYNYKEFYEDYFGSSPSAKELKEFAPQVAKSLELSTMASAWYWKKKGLNKYADADNATQVSAALNYPKALNGKESDISSINNLEERKRYVNLLKEVFDYENCCK